MDLAKLSALRGRTRWTGTARRCIWRRPVRQVRRASFPEAIGNLLAGARNVAQALAIDPGRRFLCVVPFYHSSGFHNSLILPLLNGACLILVRHFTPAACARLVAAENADVLIGSPFIYRMLLDHAHYLPTLKLCVSAGARMPQTLALAWQERSARACANCTDRRKPA